MNWTQADVDAHNARIGRKLVAECAKDARTLEKEFAAGGSNRKPSVLQSSSHSTEMIPGQVRSSTPGPTGEFKIQRPARRIRQSDKPLLNGLETAWLARFRLFEPLTVVISQSVRLRLANGAWYKADHFYFHGPVHHISEKRVAFATAIECKGPKEMKGMAKGMLALKVAAREYPQIRFLLCWKELGMWKEQHVLGDL